MASLHDIWIAGLTGIISGFMLSVPVGPINLTIMNEGARRGFYWAFMIGMGATAMEAIYCFIAFTGFSSFFSRGYVKAGMELFSFVFMLFLGIKFLVVKSINQPPVDLGPAGAKFEEEVQHRFHPSSAFMTGLVRVMGNLGVLVFWIIISAHFISREWVTPDWPGKLACVTGVAIGTGSWFAGLSWLISLKHGKLSEKTLLRMEHLSGLGLLILGLIHGGIITSQMVKAAKHHKTEHVSLQPNFAFLKPPSPHKLMR